MNHLTWLLTNQPMLEGEGGGGGTGEGNEPKLPTTAAELDALLNSRAAETRRAIEAAQPKAIQDAVDAALAKAKTDADAETQRQKDLAAGNFDEVRKGIEKERDDALKLASDKGNEATEKGNRLEKAETLLKGRLEERVKALDHDDLKDVKADYLAKFPDDSAPLLDRIDYLEDPRTAAAIARVGEPTKRLGHIPPTPKPHGNLTDAERVEQAKQQNAQGGAYQIA